MERYPYNMKVEKKVGNLKVHFSQGDSREWPNTLKFDQEGMRKSEKIFILQENV